MTYLDGEDRNWGAALVCSCVFLLGCGTDVVSPGNGSSSDASEVSDASGTGDPGLGDSTEDSGSAESGSGSGDVAQEPVDPFEGARLVRGGAPSGARTFGDFDGDGTEEIAISYQTELLSRAVVGIYGYDASTDTFEFFRQPELGRVASSLTTGHVDGNGQLDLIAMWVGFGVHSSAQVALTDEGIEAGPTVELPGFRLGFPIDFDGDRRSEQLEVRGNDIILHEVDLAGGWEVQQSFEGAPGCTPATSSWADLDGDGSLEVCIGFSCGDDRGGLSVYSQEGDGRLREVFAQELAIPVHFVGLADFDDDGLIDVLVSSSNYTGDEPAPVAQVQRGLGDGAFGEVLLDIDPDDVQFGAIRMLAADIDGDGVPEAFPKNWGSALEGVGPLETVMLTIGAELRIDRVPFDENLSPLDSFSYAADVNGDGCEDLVAGRDLTTILMPCD